MKMNSDLHNVALWFNRNKLTLNASKSKLMLFGHSVRTGPFSIMSLTICGEDLARVDSFKYLGVTLNERLSWDDHIFNIASKIRKRIAILNRIKSLLPLSARITYYNTLIRPIFDYNSVVCGDKRNSVQMDLLQVLQNRAAKTILGKELHSSATDKP